MNVHLSIDDVITSLRNLHQEMPKSVFHIPLFRYIRELCYTYGAVFTLYIFENDQSGFHISDVPQKYFDEISNENFLKFGYHGYKNVGNIQDLKLFSKELDNINNTIPNQLLSNKLRLHRYIANKSMIKVLKENGIKELLCRDEKSKNLFNSPLSYDLTEHDVISLNKGCFSKEGIIYKKTHIQLELFDENSLLKQLSYYKNEKNLVIFTHEFCVYQHQNLIKCALETLSKQGVKFVF